MGGGKMQDLLSQLLRPKGNPKKSQRPQPWRYYPRQKTQSPVTVPYQLFGYGTLEPTQDKAIHYGRLRPFLGRSDPVLSTGALRRKMLSQDLGEAERRTIEKDLWAALFSLPPTHVLRVGWISRSTNLRHDTLYLALNFDVPGWSKNGLAKSCVGYMLDCMVVCEDTALLLPTNAPIHNKVTHQIRTGDYFAAMLWLAHLFYHYKFLTCEDCR